MAVLQEEKVEQKLRRRLQLKLRLCDCETVRQRDIELG